MAKTNSKKRRESIRHLKHVRYPKLIALSRFHTECAFCRQQQEQWERIRDADPPTGAWRRRYNHFAKHLFENGFGLPD